MDWHGVDLPIRLFAGRTVNELCKLLRKVKPDLVHAGPCRMRPGWPPTGAKPLLAMSWGFDLMRDLERSARDRQRARFALSKADGLIVDAFAAGIKRHAALIPIASSAFLGWT